MHGQGAPSYLPFAHHTRQTPRAFFLPCFVSSAADPDWPFGCVCLPHKGRVSPMHPEKVMSVHFVFLHTD